ncbi:hypothetical protein GTA08_BOTSDO04631 [Botryosphaeria dothidea]|uniref:Uncharacterized protein n=1 Tax=Botryosphaeria dothidea TaxID=55169 RepID=A0A8H4IXT9_9PEZI|nr:hypothetical protein GTA08_BOTSDO04631 [Botryosphaeria dothidea]
MFSWGYKKMPDLFAQRINVEKEPVYEVEEMAEKKARTVKHLIHANHSIFSVIYHNLEFHNHVPHLLGSAYILGSTNDHLNEVYDVETETLEKWTDSPEGVSQHLSKHLVAGGTNNFPSGQRYFELLFTIVPGWLLWLLVCLPVSTSSFLSVLPILFELTFPARRRYQRAYMDFFEDQLPRYGHDWKAMTEAYLFKGPNPLINNVICGLGHSLIHLGYAYELSSRTVATEALVLNACFYNSMHKYLDDPSYTRPSPHPSHDPLTLLHRIRDDRRFDNLFPHKGDLNIYILMEKREAAVLEHWNALAVPDSPTQIFEACQRAAVAALVATRADGEKYDFFLVHLLTTSHALRHLLPSLPARWHVALARQWWLLVVTIYVAQHRPEIRRARVDDFDLRGRDWGFIVKEALDGQWRNDAHYVKALRAIKNAADTWGDDDSRFLLKAAVKFATEFGGWGGFAPLEIARTDERKHVKMGISSEEVEEAKAQAAADDNN